MNEGGFGVQFAGNEVATAHDGIEAVELAERFRPDVMLIDIGMPNLDGYETCKRIRRQSWGRNIVLIAQTGYGAESDWRRTREAGFDARLVKSIDSRALLRVIAECLMSRK